MNDVTVLVDAGGGALARGESPAVGIAVDRVEVVWEETQAAMPAAAREYLDARWVAHVAEARAQGKTLFNGPITRLIAAGWEHGRVVLRMGPADYKTFVVTRLRDRAWFEAHAPGVSVGAMGNSTFLTRGDRALLGIRSPQVSAYARRAHLLGGVLELLGTEAFPATAGGMVAHLRMELREEGALGEDELAREGPRLLGVVQDEFLAQPEAVW